MSLTLFGDPKLEPSPLLAFRDMGLNERIEARRNRRLPVIFSEEHYDAQHKPWNAEPAWAMGRRRYEAGGFPYLYGCNLFLQMQVLPHQSSFEYVEGPES